MILYQCLKNIFDKNIKLHLQKDNNSILLNFPQKNSILLNKQNFKILYSFI